MTTLVCAEVLAGAAHWCVECDDTLAALRRLPDASVHCVVTSPPYWGLRDYGTATWEGGKAGCDHFRMVGGRGTNAAQTKIANVSHPISAHRGRIPYRCGCGAQRVDRGIGLESNPQDYVDKMVEVFREVRRVLRDDGTLWLNLGDCYVAGQGERQSAAAELPCGPRQDPPRPRRRGDVDVAGWGERSVAPRIYPGREPGLRPKDLVGMPWRVAFALQADCWWLRSEIVWSKPNPMPESVRDRPTRAHEYVFLLTKRPRYFYDADAIREPFTSSVSDLKKMVEGRERIGGLVKQQSDRLLRASGHTNIGRKRAVGNPIAASSAVEARRKTALSPHAGGRRQAPEPGEPNASHPLGRNKRSVWTIATEPFPGAHFATFPKALVEPCVRAGTSERGCCPECGAQWRRITETTGTTSPAQAPPGTGQAGPKLPAAAGSDGKRFAERYESAVVTVVWEAGCDHRLDPVPSVVLDPFCGSGTTGVVAHRLARRFVGIDLNPEYVEMARRRIEQDASRRSTPAMFEEGE